MSNVIREGRELYRAGSLSGEWPANELISRIEAARAYRDSLPGKRRRLALLLVGGIVGAIVFGVLSGSFDSAVVGTICFIIMCAGVAAFITAIVRLVKLRSGQYDGDAAAVLGPLAGCIGPDLAAGSAMKVSASFKPATASDFLVRTGEKYSTGKYAECVDRFFKRDIVSLECRLSDGTRLLADVVEHTIEKVLKKKNPRGKWKTKKKYRRKIGFRVRLQLDENRCRLAGDFRLPADTTVRVRRHPRGAVILLALRRYLADKQRLDAGPLLGILAGAYTAVTPVHNKSIPSGGIQ